ncbi:MAG TPA: hypothetical protein VJ810_10210 [Blastocatellia bacterium]|nr:hypothetical protein [Blastocatellia bacterium]
MMILNMITMVSLAVACGWAQAPEGRWDGTITYGALKVPFIIHFESNGKKLTGSFVNGDTRIASTEGSFEAGSVRLTFGASDTRLEATLADGQLNGAYGSGAQDMHPFTASQFCSCGSEGDAGPDISGTWEARDSSWRLTIRRKGDDTLATVSRPSGELGPLAGHFDGVTFMLHYFDGVRAAVLEIEQSKDGGLDLKFTEPGTDVKKYRAVQATTRK